MTLREILARVFGEAGSAPVDTELRPSEVVERVRRRRVIGLVWRTASAAGTAAVVAVGVALAPHLLPTADREPAPIATGRPSSVPTSEPASPSASPTGTPRPAPTAETPAPPEETEPEPPPERQSPAPPRPGSPAPPREEGPTAAPPLGWGTSAEEGEGTATAHQPAQLADVRVGRHERFDRVVFDFASGRVPEYGVRYVSDGELRSPGSGRPVEMEGEYDMEITFRATEHAGIDDDPRTPGYQALREARYLGGYEQIHSAALGVDGAGAGKPGFRIMVLDDPRRVVVDVAH